MNLTEFMKDYIHSKIVQPELKQLLLDSIDEKASQFIFHRLTDTHLNIWRSEIDDNSRLLLFTSVEFFVLAGDILDDLQDADTTKPVWMKQDAKFSMNALLTFFNLSQRTAIEAFESKQDKTHASILFLEKQQLALLGQHASLLKEADTEEELIQIMKRKAGTFFSYAILLGSISAHFESQEGIKEYAEMGGVIAQIENDLSGITKREYFKDILMKERTLPTYFLLHHGNSEFFPISSYYKGELEGKSWLQDEELIERLIQQTGVTFYARHHQQLLLEQTVGMIQKVYTNKETQEIVKNTILGR